MCQGQAPTRPATYRGSLFDAVHAIIQAMTNREIADLFEKVADMLAIRGDSIHRILAYRRAAESIRALGRDVQVVAQEGG